MADKQELERLLERVAQIQVDAIRAEFVIGSAVSYEEMAKLCEQVLRRELLPILEAGQDLYDCCNEGKGSTQIEMAWDAAIAKALGQS